MIKLNSVTPKQDGFDPNYYRKKVKRYSQDYFTEMEIPKYLTFWEKFWLVVGGGALLVAVVKMFTL